MGIDEQLKKVFNPDPRIQEIQSELFYEFKQALQFWNQLMVLMQQSRTKTKIKGLLFTSPPDSGKSTLVNQFQYEYSKNVPDASANDIFIFSVPQGVGAVHVFAQLCRELGIPDIPVNPRNYPITHFVKKAAAKLAQDHKLLIIDEFQNLMEIPGVLRKKILSSLNQLNNNCRIPIVIVGLTGNDKMLNEIEEDVSDLKETFGSRFIEFTLDPWTDNDEFKGLLATINEDLHLNTEDNNPPFYMNNIIREKIIVYTQGLLGRIVTLLKTTAVKIIEEGLSEKITLDILEKVARYLKYIK